MLKPRKVKENILPTHSRPPAGSCLGQDRKLPAVDPLAVFFNLYKCFISLCQINRSSSGGFEFPIASAFTYETNKADPNGHTKNNVQLMQDRQPDQRLPLRMSWMVLQAFLNPSELDLGQALNLVSQARTRPETTFLTTLYPTQEWDTNQSDYRCWPAHLPSRILIGAGSGGCPLTVEAGQAAVPVVSTKAESPVNRVSSVRWRQMRKSWTSCRC